MRVSYYVVYKLECTIDGEDVEYIGSTGVPKGWSDERAMRKREEWHVDNPVKCLAAADPESMRTSVLKTKLPKDRALVDEALLLV